MPRVLSDNVAEAVAKDIFEGAINPELVAFHDDDLPQYWIEDASVIVRSNLDGGGRSTRTYQNVTDFFCELTASLVVSGEIDPEYLTTRNVGRICFHIGKIVQQQQTQEPGAS